MCRAPPTLAVSHIACNRHLTPLQLLGKLCQKEMQLIYPLFYYDCGVHACGAQHSRDATVASAPASLSAIEPRLSFGRRQGKKQHPSLSHLICRAFDTQACAANAYAQAVCKFPCSRWHRSWATHAVVVHISSLQSAQIFVGAHTHELASRSHWDELHGYLHWPLKELCGQRVCRSQ